MIKEFINNKKCLPILIFIITNVFITLNKKYYLNKEFKNYINVAYAFDKNYHYITHVSMKSIILFFSICLIKIVTLLLIFIF